MDEARGGCRLFVADTNNNTVSLVAPSGASDDLLTEFRIVKAKDQVDSNSAAKKFDLSVTSSARVKKGRCSAYQA